LFLDCDGEIISDSFLQNYIEVKNADVVIGGRVYPPKPSSRHILHWKAGISKEVFPAGTRQKNPYKSLMLNNLLIRKNVFESIKLNEKISGYGHEDTLLGYELQSRNKRIIHINNPILHSDLQTNEEFLAKTREAVKNFAWIIRNTNAGKDTGLFKSYNKLLKPGLGEVFTLFYRLFQKTIYQNLLSSNPNLLLLDLYKLQLFYLEMTEST
jgi:hypothetical protein